MANRPQQAVEGDHPQPAAQRGLGRSMRSRFNLRHLIASSLALSLAVAGFTQWKGSPALVTPAHLDAVGSRALESEPNASGGDWLVHQRGSVSVNQYRRALRQAQLADRRTAAEAPELAAAKWEFMGPTNIGGRVSDVVIDPTLPDTVYAATASGGVWKSTDAGANWASSWPARLTQAMGAMAAGSDGTLYVGTGESNPGGGSITYGGTGLYRSKDQGVTWRFVGLRKSGAFGRIVVDPSDPRRVFAAAAGDLYDPGGQRGLYLSKNGGRKWKRVLAGENATTGAVDVAVDPQDPDNILVSMWDHHREAGFRIYAGEGSGVWRSTDGGKSWKEVTIPHELAAEEVGRIGVAFSASDPNRAYAIVANKLDGTGVGVFRSDDGGATFTKTAVEGGSLSQSSFGWWFGRIWVDPDDPNTVWVPGVSLLQSTDGGDSFASVSGVHADQHAMAWDPKVPDRVYLGNDGGMYTSSDDGSTWVAGEVQGWTQHYTVDVGEQSPDHVVTGLQDNGCLKNWSVLASGIDQWASFGLCGDGLETLIDPSTEQLLYACSQYGSCSISPGGIPAGVPMSTTSDRKGWWAPLVFDPTTSTTMYFGGNRVNRSTDAGLTWTAISGDLSKNEPQLDPHAGYKIRGVLTTIAVSRSNPEVVWAGTDDGLLWKTEDAGSSAPTWTRIQSPDLPDAWVTRVAIDPDDENVVYVTYSGYRDGRDTPHVVRTTDGGATWSNISGDLPPAPANDIIPLGERLIVATDVGVFLSEDAATWYRLGGDLPAVPVTDMRYHEGTNTLTVATFGHGVQRVVLP